MNKRILWKALNGREFIIDTKELGLNSMEEVYDYIQKLREKHNMEQPTFMSAVGNVEDKTAIDINSLPNDLQQEVKKALDEAMVKPDPKKLD